MYLKAMILPMIFQGRCKEKYRYSSIYKTPLIMKYFFITGLILLFACGKQDVANIQDVDDDQCLEASLDFGKIYYQNNRLMLKGGDSANWSFDISNWSMGYCKLSNGVGRETFSALLQAKYVSIKSELSQYKPSDRCIIMFTNSVPKVYPLELMRSHEVINENVNGRPVAVVYCVLADFPGVYSREFCGKELTFAPSGYTFSSSQVDNNRRAFVLWDRETESLWWPLIDVAVSGKMIGKDMQMLRSSFWKVMSWGNIVLKYPNAIVLKRGQTMDIPYNWNKLDTICN